MWSKVQFCLITYWCCEINVKNWAWTFAWLCLYVFVLLVFDVFFCNFEYMHLCLLIYVNASFCCLKDILCYGMGCFRVFSSISSCPQQSRRLVLPRTYKLLTLKTWSSEHSHFGGGGGGQLLLHSFLKILIVW